MIIGLGDLTSAGGAHAFISYIIDDDDDIDEPLMMTLLMMMMMMMMRMMRMTFGWHLWS